MCRKNSLYGEFHATLLLAVLSMTIILFILLIIIKTCDPNSDLSWYSIWDIHLQGGPGMEGSRSTQSPSSICEYRKKKSFQISSCDLHTFWFIKIDHYKIKYENCDVMLALAVEITTFPLRCFDVAPRLDCVRWEFGWFQHCQPASSFGVTGPEFGHKQQI